MLFDNRVLIGGPQFGALARTLTASGFAGRITVFEFERALVYRRGVIARELGPGRHRVARGSIVRAVDVRPRFVTVPGQEVLTADGVTLRVSLAARFRIVDIRAAFNDVENVLEALYLTLQVALREVVGASGVEELLAQRGALTEQLAARAVPATAAFGIELASVDVKDLSFPGELKQLFAKAVAAQREGLATLERARAESAALRHLANTAKLLAEHPSLLQLRALQELGDGTLVLGLPQG